MPSKHAHALKSHGNIPPYPARAPTPCPHRHPRYPPTTTLTPYTLLPPFATFHFNKTALLIMCAPFQANIGVDGFFLGGGGFRLTLHTKLDFFFLPETILKNDN